MMKGPIVHKSCVRRNKQTLDDEFIGGGGGEFGPPFQKKSGALVYFLIALSLSLCILGLRHCVVS